MTVYAIADLHLPGGGVKPMDIFGEHWENHFEQIAENWRERVGEEDLVLLPGDLSWAMRLGEATADLDRIGALPGRKVITRGNHDYWWNSISRVREVLPASMRAVQNDCLELNDVLISGTRGWTLPGEGTDADDERIYRRELLRLEMTLKAARRLSADKRLIAMLHFPPLAEYMRDTGFTELMETYAVSDVVYGHLHGPALKGAFRGEHNGVRYHNVSCDGLNFQLYRLP